MQTLSNKELEEFRVDQVIHDAVKYGLVEFVEELIISNPQIIHRHDANNRSLFAYAVIYRQEKIFSLINLLGSRIRSIMLRYDSHKNNFLHLAAKLSPTSKLDEALGAALQMQREMKWFQEIEKMVPPKYKQWENENGHMPKSLFDKEHKKLMKEGERWMKNITTSCMVVAALVATVMFMTTFTVPGGSDSKTGFPIFLGYDAFMIFVISNALSLFSSNTSVLISLGLLIARYAKKDFLLSLPIRLMLGLATLFFAVVTMMIAFGSAIFILLQKRLSWVAVLVTILSAIPIFFFIFYQFPLLI